MRMISKKCIKVIGQFANSQLLVIDESTTIKYWSGNSAIIVTTGWIKIPDWSHNYTDPS